MKERMYKISMGAALLLGVVSVNASELHKLLDKEETLYKQAARSYAQRKNITPYLVQIKRINQKLKKEKVKQETADLLVYFDLCFSELQRIAHEPYRVQNNEILSDLSRAIEEGHTQIVKSNQKVFSMVRP